jgi:hypothetical protein
LKLLSADVMGSRFSADPQLGKRFGAYIRGIGWPNGKLNVVVVPIGC